jgi:hypothetical protein
MRASMTWIVKPSVVIVMTVALTGCQQRHPELVPVSGHVTIDGKPLAHGQITVLAEGHRASMGKIDSDGRFSLTCFKLGDGAPVGQHIATVTAVESMGEHANRWHAPKKYANKANGVWVNIDGPTEDLKVDLTWANSGQKAPFVENF